MKLKRRGPREVLDDKKRELVLSIISNGSSLRVAAQSVGCSPATITRTAQRDPNFSSRLDRAEHNLEITALRSIQNAAQQERYWRAAAWILERKNPDDFTIPNPKYVKPEQVHELVSSIVHLLTEDIPEINIRRARQRLDEFMENAYEEGLIDHFPRGYPCTRRKSRNPPIINAQHPSCGNGELASENKSISAELQITSNKPR
jgi:hypothetical protein